MEHNAMRGQGSADSQGQGAQGSGQDGMEHAQGQAQGRQASGMQGQGMGMGGMNPEAMYHAYQNPQQPYPYPPPGMHYPPPGYGYALQQPMYDPSGMMHGMGQGQGQMHGQQAQAQNAGIGQIMEEIAGGGSGLSGLTKLLDLDDKDFWKGALVGAAAVLLLTNDSVQNALFRGAVKTRDAAEEAAEKVKEGVEKVKQTVSKAKAADKETDDE